MSADTPPPPTPAPAADPRYELLIRQNPYSLHSQLCPVARSVSGPGVPGTVSDCDCWRRREAEALLAQLDAVDPLRAQPGISDPSAATMPDRAPRRIQLSRAEGWRKPAGVVVVARPTKWGNPITQEIVRLCWDDRHGPLTPAAVRAIAAGDFRSGLDGLIADPEIRYPGREEIRAELAGRDLGCWCPPGPCHADVLLEVANAPIAGVTPWQG